MVIDMLADAYEYIRRKEGAVVTVEEVAKSCGYPDEQEKIFKVLEYLCADENRSIKKVEGPDYFQSGYTSQADYSSQENYSSQADPS